jgi:prefoldin subunit 5
VQWRTRLADKDEEIENVRHDLEWRAQQTAAQQSGVAVKDEEIAKLKADNDRLRADAQAKITQLQERIKELNQKLMANGGAAAPGVKR